MNLLLIAPNYPTHAHESGGAFVRAQARTLAGRHRVTILAPRLLTPRSWLRRAGQSTSPEALDAGVTAIRVNVLNPTNRWQWMTFRRMQRGLIRAGLLHCAKAGRPDVVHAHFSRPSGLAALRIARQAGSTAVLTEHAEPFATQIDGPLRRRETGAIMREMDSVAAVSPSLRNIILKEFPRTRIDVLGNVVDESVFIPADRSSDGAPVFLFVGGLVPQKGVADLIQAASILNSTYPDLGWRIEIGGEGPLKARLQSQARAAGLENRVTFLGPLSREQVAESMRRANAFVLPSIGESFGVVAIEAMASGLPVIATRCGGPEWVIEPDTGLLVPVNSPEAIARAMSDILLRRREFSADHIRARVVERFGRDAWLAACEQFYANAIKRRHDRTTNQPT